LQNIEADPSTISRRVTFCTFGYLFLNALSIWITLPSNGRVAFINKISLFLNKFDSLSTEVIDSRIYSLRRFKLLGAILVGFEIIIAASFLLQMGRRSALKQIQWAMTLYARVFMVVLEQLSNLICMEIKLRFCVLNRSIRTWSPKTRFFCKVLGPNSAHAFGTVKTASTQFSNLSLALQAVQDQFGLFWLMNIIHLGAIVIVISATMPTAGIVLFYGALIALALLRLVLFCDVCGETSSQVRCFEMAV
jgi:hypothetical protein